MTLSPEFLSELFTQIVSQDETYQEAVRIVRANSYGKIWLIGGFLYRTLASQLYGVKKPSKDFDFIVERAEHKLILPESWKVTVNRFGNPKFVGTFEIDFVTLNRVHSIMRRGVEPNIQNFLNGVPLNIHSLVYDVDNEEVIGNIGISALERKVVSVCNPEMAIDTEEIYQTLPLKNKKK